MNKFNVEKITEPQLISKLPTMRVHDFVTVYDYEHLTTQEIISAVIAKINELIDALNSVNIDEILKRVEELINEMLAGLDDRIKAIIIKMFSDGELDPFIELVVNKILDKVIDSKLDSFLLTEKFKNRVKEIVLEMDLQVDLSNYYTKPETLEEIRKAITSIDLSNYYTKPQTLEEIKKAMTEKKPAQIYKMYNTINIIDNNTFIRGDLIYFNFKVVKTDTTHFSANVLYKIGRFSYKPVNYINTLNGVSKSNSTGILTALSGGFIDGNGDISLSVNQNSKEILITGIVPLLIPINGIPTPTTPPTITPEPEFKEKLPYQIYNDLLQTQGYIIEDENGVQHTLKHETRRIKFIISAIGGLEPQTGYELLNMWGDYRGFDEVRRILSYTFTWDEVNFIMEQWTSRADVNLITIIVRDKAIRWNDISGIGIGLATDMISTLPYIPEGAEGI